jgi:dipeptidyl aminopeptidase/acylaminoacyl peptidase
MIVIIRMKRLLIAALLGVTLGGITTPIIVTEGALHMSKRPQPDPHDADGIARQSASNWAPARLIAPGGAALDGWLFTPRAPNGSAVILLHGVGDTREGMVGHAVFLLDAGYTILLPDSRGHGASGGGIVTYGIRESADVHAWVDWLLRQRPVEHLYGLGESLGAAILLQSLPREPRFRAVVADCPFDTFEDVAYYRLERASGLGRWAAGPVIGIGFFYTRAVYGVDLRQASPAAAILTTKTPVLLIHGTADSNIPPRQSEILHALNPQSTTLWLLPGAPHVGALSRSPQEYERRVIEWFATHP